MSTDVRTNVNELQATGLQPASSSVSALSTTAPNSIHGDNIVGDGNQDMVVTTASANNTTATTKRSAEELYNKLLSVGMTYNLNKQDLKTIFETVSGMSENQLLNAEENDVNSIISIINKSIEILKKQKQEINAENIINISKNLKIKTDNGWTLEEAYKSIINNPSSEESLADKLRRVYPKYFDKDFDFSDPQNRELIKEKVQAYIKDYYRTERIGIRDTARMLACSKNDAERDLFDSILREISPEYRARFVSSWLYSYDVDTNRVDAARRTKENIFGITDDTTEEQSEEIAYILNKNLDEEGTTATDPVVYEGAKKYFEDNHVAEILEKIAKNIELSDEENNILNRWKNQYLGVIKGSANGTIANQIISDEYKEEHLHNYVNPQIYSYGEETYREIIENIKEFYENHSNDFDMNEEEFIKLLDEVTDNNYSIIINDSANGTTTELNAPAAQNTQEQTTTPAETTTTDYGFSYTKETIDENIINLTAKKAEIISAGKEDGDKKQKTTTTDLFSNNKTIVFRNAILNGFQAVKEFAEKFNISLREISVDILNSGNASQTMTKWALQLFDRQNDSMKQLIFERQLTRNDGKIAAAKYMKAEQLERLNNSSNAYVAQQIDRIIEEDENRA